VKTQLLQVFLSPNQSLRIYEVSKSSDDTIQCTCDVYISRSTCKHTRFVDARIEENGGSYPLQVSDRATFEDAEQAHLSEEAFRSFIIRFGKIEVY